MYVIIGLVCIYAAMRNLRDQTNKKRIGTAIFWGVLGLLFIIGRWIPSEVAGGLVIVMVLPPIFKQVGAGKDTMKPSEHEMHEGFQALGSRIFIPAFSIGVVALLFALFTSISSLV